MDPFAQVTQYETTEGAGDGGGSLVEAPFVPAAAPEPTAAAEPVAEPQGWQGFQDEDSFRSAVAEQSAQMFEERMNQLLQQQQGQQQGGQIGDLNALLDPMGDQFGQNLAQLLAAQQQQLMSQFAPVLDHYSQQQQIAQTEALAAPIFQADTARHGEMSAEQRSVALTLADSFVGNHERIYGQDSPRAQQAALQQALQAVRAIAGTSAAAGRQDAVDQLHAASQGLRVPNGSGASAPTAMQPPARSPQELLERRFGPNGMTPSRAA